jgi:hypothetical protein
MFGHNWRLPYSVKGFSGISDSLIKMIILKNRHQIVGIKPEYNYSYLGISWERALIRNPDIQKRQRDVNLIYKH